MISMFITRPARDCIMFPKTKSQFWGEKVPAWGFNSVCLFFFGASLLFFFSFTFIPKSIEQRMISELVGNRVEKFESILETIPRVERNAYVNELLLQQRPIPKLLPRHVVQQAMDARQRALFSREAMKTTGGVYSSTNFSTPSHFKGDDARAMLIAQRKAEKRALASVNGTILSASKSRKLPW